MLCKPSLRTLACSMQAPGLQHSHTATLAATNQEAVNIPHVAEGGGRPCGAGPALAGVAEVL